GPEGGEFLRHDLQAALKVLVAAGEAGEDPAVQHVQGDVGEGRRRTGHGLGVFSGRTPARERAEAELHGESPESNVLQHAGVAGPTASSPSSPPGVRRARRVSRAESRWASALRPGADRVSTTVESVAR